MAGQGNFGQHEKGLALLLEDLRNRLEIDLGFARTGDAVEQGDGKGCGIGRGPQLLDRLGLWTGEIDAAVGGIGGRKSAFGNGDFDERAGRDQPIDDAGRAVGFGRQRVLGAHQAVGGKLQYTLACGGEAGWGGSDPLDAEARLDGFEQGARPHQHPCNHAERGQGVARDPFRELQRQGGQWGYLGQDLGDALELFCGYRLWGLADGAMPDEADARLRTEGNQHEGPRRRLATIGQQIVVGLVEGDRQQHRHRGANHAATRQIFSQSCKQTFQTDRRGLERRISSAAGSHFSCPCGKPKATGSTCAP